MKKRGTLLPAALALLLLLGACGGGQGLKSYEPSDVKALLNAGAFTGEMEEVDADVAAMLYGVEESAVKACACVMAADSSVSADEAAVFVLIGEDEAVKAAVCCQKRAEKLIEQCRDYCPDQVPKLEKATIIQRGSTVLFAVGDSEKLGKALDELKLR